MLTIRPATHDDRTSLWAMLEPVIRAGEVFALPTTMTRESALDYWFHPAIPRGWQRHCWQSAAIQFWQIEWGLPVDRE